MFTAALLTIAKVWKQPKCPSMDEQRNYGIYIKGNIIQPEKEENFAIYDNIIGPWGHYAEWNQTKTNTLWSHLYVESKKQNNTKLN